MEDLGEHQISVTDQEAEKVGRIVNSELSIVEMNINYDEISIKCDFSDEIHERFKNVMRNLKRVGFIPILREEDGDLFLRVRRYEQPEGGATSKHYILFLATVLTTLVAGSLMFGIDVFSKPLSIWKGWPFSASILLILGSHEFGHFFLSEESDVIATPPYFIPVPPPFILGTLGAVIRMKSPIPDRKSLFDIGVAGPFLGVIFAVPVTLLGLYLSPIPLPEGGEGAIQLGTPLIYQALSYLMPVENGGLHPVAFAGWVGFFVTFLNLLPVGQLDGGHIAKALFGDYHNHISRVVPFLLFAMGIYLTMVAGLSGGEIWIFWGVITLFFHSAGHQPPLNDVSSLDKKRKILGILVYLLMIACFTPVPFTFISP